MKNLINKAYKNWSGFIQAPRHQGERLARRQA